LALSQPTTPVSVTGGLKISFFAMGTFSEESSSFGIEDYFEFQHNFSSFQLSTYLSTSAILALYQFMNRDVIRLMVKYINMIMATPSMA